MGFRFLKRVKIAKGLQLNISKSGLSLSAGPRGAKVTLGQKGVRTTVGIPGTGISYTKNHSFPKSDSARTENSGAGASGLKGMFLFFVLILAIVGFVAAVQFFMNVK